MYKDKYILDVYKNVRYSSMRVNSRNQNNEKSLCTHISDKT